MKSLSVLLLAATGLAVVLANPSASRTFSSYAGNPSYSSYGSYSSSHGNYPSYYQPQMGGNRNHMYEQARRDAKGLGKIIKSIPDILSLTADWFRGMADVGRSAGLPGANNVLNGVADNIVQVSKRIPENIDNKVEENIHRLVNLTQSFMDYLR